MANTIISKIATKVFYTFPNDKIDGKKHILSGPVMNEDLLKTIKNMSVTENTTLEILVIAGSQ